MPTFNVHLTETVSTTVTVEADDYQAAMEAAWDSDNMPGSITYGAFGQAPVDEAGDWEVFQVTDESGDVVWAETDEKDAAIAAELLRFADLFTARLREAAVDLGSDADFRVGVRDVVDELRARAAELSA